MTIYITYFSTETEQQMKTAFDQERFVLGSHKDVRQIENNDIAVMINLTTKEWFGVARINGKCIEPHPYDSHTIYTNKIKYNRYEINVKQPFFLRKRMSLETLRELIGGKKEYKTNIYKGFPCSWVKAFVTHDNDQETVVSLQRFYDLVQTYV